MPGAGRRPGKACCFPALWAPLQACSGAAGRGPVTAEAGPLSGPKGMQQRGLRPPRGVMAATAVLQVDETREPPALRPPRAPGHSEGAPHRRRDPAGHGRHQLFQDGGALPQGLCLGPFPAAHRSAPKLLASLAWASLHRATGPDLPIQGPVPASVPSCPCLGRVGSGPGSQSPSRLCHLGALAISCWSGGPVLRMWGCPQLF